ncbi:response regulator [Leucothrix pacifica]|uniref:histidine kinase n=1 Tax=Leucothrix pacifica TaxID=1247513 RepID=A0A317CU12_9GAMM|nr:response regulator [Leucothrix pacifica]PWQ99950.1 hypothetical protein DKW60_03860 [Leucothrix pacifica]
MSFRFRFVFSFILLETLFMVCIVVVNFNSLERESRQLMTDKTKLASTMFSEVVSTPLIVNDLATIDDAAQRFVAMPGVVQVELFNDEGQLLSSSFSDQAQYQSESIKPALTNNLSTIEIDSNGVKQLEDYHFLTVTDPITVEQEEIGSANFVYDITRSIVVLNNNAFWTYLLAGIEIFISTIVALFMGFRIATAIDKLSFVTKEIAENRPVEIPRYKKRGDEIDQLYGSVKTMQDNIMLRTSELVEESKKARAASKAKSDFLATMSHEIRTPINGVMGSLELIDLPDLKEKDASQVRTALSSAEMLMTTVTDILDYSKMEAGKLTIHNKPVSLDQFVDNIEDIYRPLVENKGLAFVIDKTNLKQHYVFVDESRLKQVLSNYLNNAIKFTQSGVIQLNAESTPEGQVSFMVIDQGVGIRESDMSLLFQEFSQIDSGADRHFGGTGLGLVIVKKLAQLMNGTTHVESEFGRGSKFSVQLQLVSATAQDFESTQPKPVESLTNTTTLDAKVLLVEDNLINQKVAQKVLEKIGCSVTLANNGLEALEHMGTDRFDVVLMDCQMPVMDGLTATTKIRETDAKTPIIALTANAQEADKDACFAAGMNDFVSKPFKQKSLFSAMAAQIAGNPVLACEPA